MDGSTTETLTPRQIAARAREARLKAKNPARYHAQRQRAGRASQAQRRATLGEDGYRAEKRTLYAQTLAVVPDFAAQGGRASQESQRTTLGEAGYRARKRRGYDCAVAKHGREVILRHIRNAHAATRAQRLAHPNVGEVALHAALVALGANLISEEDSRDYLAWFRGQSRRAFGRLDVIIEAQVGRYCIDALFPTLWLALESVGGVHKLQRAYDARRRVALEGWGLRVIEFAADDLVGPAGPEQVRQAVGRYVDVPVGERQVGGVER